MKWRSSNFKHLEIDADNWIGMNLVQRDSHIKCCLNIPSDKIAKSSYAEPEVVECDLCCLSVSYQFFSQQFCQKRDQTEMANGKMTKAAV